MLFVIAHLAPWISLPTLPFRQFRIAGASAARQGARETAAHKPLGNWSAMPPRMAAPPSSAVAAEYVKRAIGDP
eukprot:8538706-Pyramimonas_sp.AAC.1